MRHFLFGVLFTVGLVSAAAQAPDLTLIGPEVGARAHEFSGVDQFGRRHTLQSLVGRDGLMLVFYRSADW
jgi:hypothetical protein